MPKGHYPRQPGLKRHMPIKDQHTRFFEKVRIAPSDDSAA